MTKQTTAEASAHDHTGRIGASRAAAVLRKDPRCTPVKAWLEIRGEKPEEDNNLAEAAKWGTVFEEAVAVHGYQVATGHKVERVNRTLRLPGFPLSVIGPNTGKSALTCHLDRRVVAVKPGRIYQGKCRDRFLRDKWGPSGTDEVPRPELIQVCVEMEIANAGLTGGVQYVDIGVLFGGNTFAHFEVERDPELGLAIVQQLVEWYRKHIILSEEPEPMSEKDCMLLWTTTNTVSVPVTMPAMDALEEFCEGDRMEKSGKELKDAARLKLRTELGRAEDIVREINIHGKPPKVKPLVRWPMTNYFDAEKFKKEQPEAAARHMHLDTGALRKAEAKLYKRYQTNRRRGDMRVTNAARALFENEKETK